LLAHRLQNEYCNRSFIIQEGDAMTASVSGSTASDVKAGVVPGPRGRWLMGCTRELLGDQLGFYERTWRRYGDFVKVRLVAGMNLYMVFRPEDVEHVLVRNHRNYRKPAFFTAALGVLAGKGLVTSDGDLWRTQRKLAQPAFGRERIAALGSLMVETVEGLVAEWSRGAAGQVVDIQEAMSRLTLKIAGLTLFGSDVSGGADSIGGALRVAVEHVRTRMDNPMTPPGWMPTAENRRFAKAKGVLDKIVLDLIEARRREPSPRNDLLGMLLAAQDEETGLGMSDAQLKDEVLTLLLAGHDTVGAALSWTWYLLAGHPEIQEQVFDEVRGQVGDRAPTVADLPGLPLTRAAFEEAMRLYPPAPGMPRQAIGPDEIGGCVIPRKSHVMVCQWITHRHPEFWPDPERFDPERFLPGHSEGRPKFAYFPFGGGPRSCIGNHFAMMEAVLILAAIVRRFRVELMPGQEIVPNTTFVLKPQPGVKVSLWPR
jgi:cytochrome P450